MIQGLMYVYCPSFLEVQNDSEQHRGHKGIEEAERSGDILLETHFKIILIADAFQTLNRVERHRHLYDVLRKVLGETLFSRIHALSLKLLSPAEFESNPLGKGGAQKLIR